MNKEAAIMGLYEAVNGPIDNKNAKRYADSTQTLYQGKVIESIMGQQVVEKTKDFIVSSAIYKKIVCGEHPYLITNRKDVLIGEEVRIVEEALNGRVAYKTILSVETEDAGLAEGYIALTFSN